MTAYHKCRRDDKSGYGTQSCRTLGYATPLFLLLGQSKNLLELLLPDTFQQVNLLINALSLSLQVLYVTHRAQRACNNSILSFHLRPLLLDFKCQLGARLDPQSAADSVY